MSFINFRSSFSRKSSLKPANLSSFSKERQASIVSKPQTPNMDEMKWVFNKFDTNKDGKISRDEYKAALKLLGKSEGVGEIETTTMKTFQAIDADGDGFIDFKEFVQMMHNMDQGGVNKNDIQNAFRVFDLDGNGKISAEELMHVLKTLGERSSLESCRRMIRAVDSDGDGLIDLDEFMSMMTRTMKLV